MSLSRPYFALWRQAFAPTPVKSGGTQPFALQEKVRPLKYTFWDYTVSSGAGEARYILCEAARCAKWRPSAVLKPSLVAHRWCCKFVRQSVYARLFCSQTSNVCRFMHNQQWQCTAPPQSLSQTGENSFWLWEGHPKQFYKPLTEAEDAAAWAVKSGKLQQPSGMRYANSPMPSQLNEQHQQQFAGYWSQQDDRILSPYMPGYQCQEPRSNSSPALSIEPVTGHQGTLFSCCSCAFSMHFHAPRFILCSFWRPACFMMLSCCTYIQVLRQGLTWCFQKNLKMTTC